MDDQSLDSIYNYIHRISAGVDTTATNTTSSFVLDGFNIMAIIALILSIIATFANLMQWFSTRRVNESVKSSWTVSEIAFSNYLPDLMTKLYIYKIKALSACLYLLTANKDAASETISAIEEWQIEKLPYNTKVAEQMLKRYPHSEKLFNSIEQLKRMAFMVNDFVTITCRHLINPAISDKSKIADILAVSSQYSDVCKHIYNVLNQYNSINVEHGESPVDVNGILREKILHGHSIIAKDCVSDADDTDIRDLATDICRRDRRNSSFIYDALADEDITDKIVDDICKYYPMVASIEIAK